jgi:cytosine/adenosine deaminase-related metal-dependent hydrolase
MFAEMRAFARSNKSISPRRIVEMATINGARALGLQRRVGELREKAYADLVAIPFKGRPAETHQAILHHDGDVAASMIDGQWALVPKNLN